MGKKAKGKAKEDKAKDPDDVPGDAGTNDPEQPEAAVAKETDKPQDKKKKKKPTTTDTPKDEEMPKEAEPSPTEQVKDTKKKTKKKKGEEEKVMDTPEKAESAASAKQEQPEPKEETPKKDKKPKKKKDKKTESDKPTDESPAKNETPKAPVTVESAPDEPPETANETPKQPEGKKKKKKSSAKKQRDIPDTTEKTPPVDEKPKNDENKEPESDTKPAEKQTKKKKKNNKNNTEEAIVETKKEDPPPIAEEKKEDPPPVAEEKPVKKDAKMKTKNCKVKVEGDTPIISNAVKADTEEVPMLNDVQYEQLLKMSMIFSNIKKTAKKHNVVISDTNQGLTRVEDSLLGLEKMHSPAQLIWKISDFKRRFVEARNGTRKVLYSPEIESHRYGYKLALSLCPNGDGKGAGTHMSMFFSILRGEYDDLLPWPFACKLQFTLFDQSTVKKRPKNHIRGSFVPNPTAQNLPFLGQPTSFRNPSLGLPVFASLVDVWGEDDKYVFENAIFIKIEIDLNGLDTRTDC